MSSTHRQVNTYSASDLQDREGEEGFRRLSDTSAIIHSGPGFDHHRTHKRFSSVPSSSLPANTYHHSHQFYGDRNRTQHLQKAKHKLEHAFVRDRLSQKLARRPDAEFLVQQNILKPEHIAPSLIGAQKQLQHNMAADKLGYLLEKRQNLDDLESQNILRDVRVAPSLQGVQQQLSMNLAKSNLYHALKQRPSRESLEAHGILPINFEDDDGTGPYYFYVKDSTPTPPELFATTVQAAPAPPLHHTTTPSHPPQRFSNPNIPTNSNPTNPNQTYHKTDFSSETLSFTTTSPTPSAPSSARSTPPTSTSARHPPPQLPTRDTPISMGPSIDQLHKPRSQSQPPQPPPTSTHIQPPSQSFESNADQIYFESQFSHEPQHHGRRFHRGYLRRSKDFILTRLLLKFVVNLYTNGEITAEQKGALKNMIVDQDPTVLAAAEVYEIDNDIDEFKDTLSRMIRPKRKYRYGEVDIIENSL